MDRDRSRDRSRPGLKNWYALQNLYVFVYETDRDRSRDRSRSGLGDAGPLQNMHVFICQAHRDRSRDRARLGQANGRSQRGHRQREPCQGGRLQRAHVSATRPWVSFVSYNFKKGCVLSSSSCRHRHLRSQNNDLSLRGGGFPGGGDLTPPSPLKFFFQLSPIFVDCWDLRKMISIFSVAAYLVGAIFPMLLP